MSVNYDALIEKVISRVAELVQTGASAEQLGYLSKALEILEKVKDSNTIADALYKTTDFNAKLIEAKQLLEKAQLSKLGKPAVFLWGTTFSAWDYEQPLDPTSQDQRVNFSYTSLKALKTVFIPKVGFEVKITQKGRFHFNWASSFYGDNGPFAWSLWVLRNSSKETKEVQLTATLSSRSGGNSGAYIVVEGELIYSHTSNSPSAGGKFKIQIPPNSSKLIYIQNWGYYQTYNNSNYLFRLIHHVDFDLPEGVDFDYDAIAQLIN